MLAIFEKVNGELRKSVCDITNNVSIERSITIVTSTIEDFTKEKIPLYAAIKKEGKIIWGNVDLTISQEKPDIKYAEAFKKSKEFETQKVMVAEEMLKRHPSYGTAELCYIAAKHAIQMALAMKGIGYSSKVSVLLPLANEHLGSELTEKFKRLFELYIKSEYGIKFLTVKESKLAVKYAKEILKVYER
ncbi:MAG: hypothetical protein Fur0020_13320 [Thermodesulfovibrionia bacterium]